MFGGNHIWIIVGTCCASALKIKIKFSKLRFDIAAMTNIWIIQILITCWIFKGKDFINNFCIFVLVSLDHFIAKIYFFLYRNTIFNSIYIPYFNSGQEFSIFHPKLSTERIEKIAAFPFIEMNFSFNQFKWHF